MWRLPMMGSGSGLGGSLRPLRLLERRRRAVKERRVVKRRERRMARVEDSMFESVLGVSSVLCTSDVGWDV